MPSNEPGYYVPCVVTPVGPPTPEGAPIIVACPAMEQPAPFGISMFAGPSQMPMTTMTMDPTESSSGNMISAIEADGTPVIDGESPASFGESPASSGGVCGESPVSSGVSGGGAVLDQWGFLHEFQPTVIGSDGWVDSDAWANDGMYFDPTMFYDGSMAVDVDGNPIWILDGGFQCVQHRTLSHLHVPKGTDLSPYSENDQKAVTTLMIRNIPNRYSRKMVMDELDLLGFRGHYDFIYVPMDKFTHWNVGYAFVNFVEPKYASRCMVVLTNYQFRRFKRASGKVAQVAPAHIQGLDNNLKYYRDTAVGNATFHSARPLFVRPRPDSGDRNQATLQWVEADSQLEDLDQVKQESGKCTYESGHPKSPKVWCGTTKSNRPLQWAEWRRWPVKSSWGMQHKQTWNSMPCSSRSTSYFAA